MNFASFPAIRTIIFAIGTKTDAKLSLAVVAIAVARALLFRLIALRTQDYNLHGMPFVPLPELEPVPAPTMLQITIGQPGAREQDVTVTGSWLLSTLPGSHSGLRQVVSSAVYDHKKGIYFPSHGPVVA